MNPRRYLRSTFVGYYSRSPIMEPLLKAAVLLAASALAFAASFELRFDLAAADPEWKIFWKTLPILIAIRACANWFWELHRHWWRFVSVPDVSRIL
jgi:hypothetical protein